MFTKNVCFYENKKSYIYSLTLKERNYAVRCRPLKYYLQSALLSQAPTCPPGTESELPSPSALLP